MEYISVQEAIPLSGLRIAFTRGVPGPWSMAAKEFLQIKRIPFVAVAQEGAQPNEELRAWTGQNSAPVAVLDRERPRCHWSEILMLAERLAPEPALIPADEADRTAMFGICHELCGEDGLGWSCRLLMLDALDRVAEGTHETSPFSGMWHKFTSGRIALDHARRRVVDIMAALASRLQHRPGTADHFLIGRQLSAADIYWTAFSNLISPMAHEQCPMPEFYRVSSAGQDPALRGAVPSILIDHRERILRNYFTLPMSF